MVLAEAYRETYGAMIALHLAIGGANSSDDSTALRFLSSSADSSCAVSTMRETPRTKSGRSTHRDDS